MLSRLQKEGERLLTRELVQTLKHLNGKRVVARDSPNIQSNQIAFRRQEIGKNYFCENGDKNNEDMCPNYLNDSVNVNASSDQLSH